MFKAILTGIAAIFVAASVNAAEKPVQVMVLGAYHFGNPGLDTNNIKVDSVLTPDKQKQLDAVATVLLTFKPTHVMVEMQSEEPDFNLAAYRRFTTDRLKTEANEIDQIGFRIAKRAGLAEVQGIDEQPKAGEPDYYPYDVVQSTAAQFDQTKILDDGNATVKTWLAQFENDQKTASVASLLVRTNSDPLYLKMDSYYSWLRIGDKDVQAGADLNAMWYLRNAKIFGKLMQVAKPGDRILVVYGGGHGFWLRHFASLVPGYRNVDVMPYLARAK